MATVRGICLKNMAHASCKLGNPYHQQIFLLYDKKGFYTLLSLVSIFFLQSTLLTLNVGFAP